MKNRLIAAVATAVVMSALTLMPSAKASPSDKYSGTNFGEGNLPAGCIRDMSRENPDNICHHMKTGLNALDSPQVDVLVLVPVSATAERDMRIMRQSIEMWEGGIDYLASEMGLSWLADGMDFHVTVDYVDVDGGEGGEFTTYPIVDPEIVVIATNPVGGVGIGVDPIDFVDNIQRVITDDQPVISLDEEGVPCHGIQNPFDFEHWANLPGFDSHHGERSGTYVEDCGGSGGNICFAINGAIDPAPDKVDVFNLFDLVSHEVGHCLTIGHVGDGADGTWGVVPAADIMSYSSQPAGLNKCVSTLDVEGIAIRMSRYLDVNGDGAVDAADRLFANDAASGDFTSQFHVQHPDDHLYASSTGAAGECPQPDLGLTPSERTDWTPTPSSDPPPPTSSVASFDDADDDATTALTEILRFDVAVTSTHVEATLALAELWPSTTATSATSYSVIIDGRQFDSFVRYPHEPNPKTWDAGAIAYMEPGTSSWDLEAKTVTFRIPRSYLDSAGIAAPYMIASSANFGGVGSTVADDRAPEAGAAIAVASP